MNWVSAHFSISRSAAVITAVLSISGACVAEEPAFPSNGVEERAASVLGHGDSVVVTLVRELTEWRRRALAAEATLGGPAVDASESKFTQATPSAVVLGSLEAERMLIFSIGRTKGAVQGALVSVGDRVVAKIVESRESVSAALVESSYKGSLAALEGSPIRLAVRN
jgi:hypothetical protein